MKYSIVLEKYGSRRKQIKCAIVCTAVMCCAQSLYAESVAVTEAGTANGYGDFSGLAIDFDATTGISADWTPDLIADSLYSVDSISVFNRDSSNTTPYYLGVYSMLTENNSFATEVSGFLGASDSAIVISGAPGIRTWDFTAGTNVPGGGNLEIITGSTAGNGFTAADDDTIPAGTTISGDGLYFFVLQDTPDAVTGLIDAGNANGVERIDGDGGSLDDELAGVLHGGNINTLKLDRAPEYQASLTLLQVGPIPDIELTLQVNPVNGDARILSSSTDPIEIDFYQIESPAGSLSTAGWTSVDEREGSDPAGAGWVEAGGSNAMILGEGSLTEMLVFNEGGFLDIGAPFNPAETQDLIFQVGTSGGTDLLEGAVEYVEFQSFAEADFDQDGDVDNVDLATWEGAFAVNADGDTNLDGSSNGTDFLTWQRQFTGSANLTAAAVVPEPGSWMLLSGATLVLLRRYRDKKIRCSCAFRGLA